MHKLPTVQLATIWHEGDKREKAVVALDEYRELEARIKRADHIILMLTADHNTGKHYLQGFEMARKYFQDFPDD